MPPWGQVLGFVSVIIAIVGAVFRITRAVERAQHQLDSRLERIELGVAVVESQNRAYLQVFPKVISGLVQAHVITVETGIEFVSQSLGGAPIADLLREIKPTGNPLSQGDLDRLRAYLERLQNGQPLTLPEAQDYYRITNIITQEYPANDKSWLLFLIGGFILGAMFSDIRK